MKANTISSWVTPFWLIAVLLPKIPVWVAEPGQDAVWRGEKSLWRIGLQRTPWLQCRPGDLWGQETRVKYEAAWWQSYLKMTSPTLGDNQGFDPLHSIAAIQVPWYLYRWSCIFNIPNILPAIQSESLSLANQVRERVSVANHGFPTENVVLFTGLLRLVQNIKKEEAGIF